MTVKKVNVGGCVLGNGKIYIQSMLSVPADDIDGNVRQAKELERAGCEIIRTAVPHIRNAELITALKRAVDIPVVADIHFDYRIALECAAKGVDKIRINPGNIGGEDNVRAVAEECKKRSIHIRIGVNSGSLEKDILARYGSPTAEALVESAERHISMLTRYGFEDIVISIKSSDVPTMIKAYRLARERMPYPLHLGVTEAGTERMGIIKSAVGIGSLLCDGIGETIRVSLTDDPIKEIVAAKDILRSIGMYGGARLVSCPTCGRTQIDLIGLAHKVEELIADIDADITVAVMGCIVNGPGEAREADIGIAGGDGRAVIFSKGEKLCTVDEKDALDVLMKEVYRIAGK